MAVLTSSSRRAREAARAALWVSLLAAVVAEAAGRALALLEDKDTGRQLADESSSKTKID